MALVKLSDLFGGPWGIVEHRRNEIEGGFFGAYGRVFSEELGRYFCTITQAAKILGCSLTTAYKWVRAEDITYICHEDRHLYVKAEIEALRIKRNGSRKKNAAS